MFSMLRYIHLYDEPDVIDFMKERMESVDNPVLFEELQKDFLRPVHIFNSDKKKEKLKQFYKENQFTDKGKRRITVDFYNFYKYEFKH
jgi:hypothetical protein